MEGRAEDLPLIRPPIIFLLPSTDFLAAVFFVAPLPFLAAALIDDFLAPVVLEEAALFLEAEDLLAARLALRVVPLLREPDFLDII